MAASVVSALLSSRGPWEWVKQWHKVKVFVFIIDFSLLFGKTLSGLPNNNNFTGAGTETSTWKSRKPWSRHTSLKLFHTVVLQGVVCPTMTGNVYHAAEQLTPSWVLHNKGERDQKYKNSWRLGYYAGVLMVYVDPRIWFCSSYARKLYLDTVLYIQMHRENCVKQEQVQKEITMVKLDQKKKYGGFNCRFIGKGK